MEKITYDLVRSGRKTIELRILADGALQVRAPYKVPRQEIDRFVDSKQFWIETHRATQRSRQPVAVAPRTILYKGQWYTIGENDRGALYFDGSAFTAPKGIDDDALRASLPGLMHKLAKQVLVPQVYATAKEMQLNPARVTITGAKTKWGSCSGVRQANTVPTVGQNISLSWRLIAAPPDAIHYVIVHELCHMRELNHSPAFWAWVERYVPDWRAQKEKLAKVQTWLEAYYGR